MMKVKMKISGSFRTLEGAFADHMTLQRGMRT